MFKPLLRSAKAECHKLYIYINIDIGLAYLLLVYTKVWIIHFGQAKNTDDVLYNTIQLLTRAEGRIKSESGGFFSHHQTSPVFRLCLLYIRYVGFTKRYKKNRFFLFFGQIYLTLYLKPHKNSPNARWALRGSPPLEKKRNHIQRRETFQMNMVLIALLIHGAASSAFDAPSPM